MSFSANVGAAVAGFIVTFLILPGLSLGQDGNPDHNPAPSVAGVSANPGTINDATLKRTAKAYVKVRQIVDQANNDLGKTTDRAQQQHIATAAEAKKMAAVKSEGLQPLQYNQILQLARADKTFAQKFLPYVNDVKRSSS